MAKPKKTKSGKWRLRIYNYTDENGKKVYECITKDTKADCEFAAAEFRKFKKGQKSEPMTVGDAIDKYIDLCRTLSPATVDGYEKIRRTGFQSLMRMDVESLDDVVLQQAVNEESVRSGRRGPISPKTVANEWGLISSALWQICRVRYEVRLPKRQKRWKQYPEAGRVINAVKGSSVELPCLLALMLSFRMSEIRGLKWTDIDGDRITINRVVVDAGTTPVEKEEAKTQASLRTRRIPPRIKDLLDQADKSQEYIVPMNHSQIYGRFKRICKKNDLDITFHDLRHLSASIMMSLGIPEKYRQEMGGWETSIIMKGTYEHAFSSQRAVAEEKMVSFFDQFY